MAGEGSVYRRERARPDGTTLVRWVAQASCGGRGDRRIVRRSCRTRAEARAALEGLLRPTPASDAALGAYLRSWLDERAANLAPNTARGYRHVIPHWAPIAHVPLRALSAEGVAAALAAMALGPRTRRNALGMLRAALADAEARGHVPRNVARLVRPPRVPRDAREPLGPDGARALLAEARAERYGAAIALGLCGLRIGEALGLAWADVDLDAGTVSIRHQLAGSGRRAALVPTKTDGSATTIHVPAFASRALRDHRAAQLAERVASGVATEDGLAFLTRRGWPVHPEEVRKQLRAALARAGLPAMRFHDLRHAAASLLVAGGAHPRVAQRLLRHATPGITLGVYSHVSGAQERDAADLLDRLVGGA